MTSITSITSSRDLLALVWQYRPVADGSELAFDLDPPEGLVPALSVLHTGVRALLVGRPWWGSSDCNAKRAKVAELNPGGPVPDWCGLLCVEGDPRWDRIHPACLLYTSPSPRDGLLSRMPSSA